MFSAKDDMRIKCELLEKDLYELQNKAGLDELIVFLLFPSPISISFNSLVLLQRDRSDIYLQNFCFQNEELLALTEESRSLRDEVDILRHNSDKVVC